MINLPNIGLRLLNWSLRRKSNTRHFHLKPMGVRHTVNYATCQLYETSTYKTPLG